jgi:glycerophosphoryl diester phosphodiesterase
VGRQRPDIIAHGGSKALWPENTMTAFAGSDSIGVDMLEMDVMLTRDSVLVCYHSETLGSFTDGEGRIADYTLAELGRFDFGYKFLDSLGRHSWRGRGIGPTTLEAIIARFGGRYVLCIELKNKDELLGPAAARELSRLLSHYGIETRALVSCFDDATLDYFRQVSGHRVATVAAKDETRRIVLRSKLGLMWATHLEDAALQIPVESGGHRLDTRRVIRAAHRRGVAVHYWTVNDPAEMERLLHMGADGLITDRPDVMQQVLARMGYVFP